MTPSRRDILNAMDEVRDAVTEDEINDLLDGDSEAGWEGDDDYE